MVSVGTDRCSYQSRLGSANSDSFSQAVVAVHPVAADLDVVGRFSILIHWTVAAEFDYFVAPVETVAGFLSH